MINLVPDAIASLKEWGIEGPFEYGLVLGTGLGPVAELIENPVIVPYAQLPGFPNGQVANPASLPCRAARIITSMATLRSCARPSRPWRRSASKI